MFVTDIIGDAKTTETITPTTAKGITPAKLKSSGMSAIAAIISVEDNSINYTLDGTTPTDKAISNIGHQALADTTIVLRGENNLRGFQMIDRLAANDSIVKVTVFF